MSKVRVLIQLKPHGSVSERIKHKASDVLTYREMSSNPVKGRFFISQSAVTLK